MKNKYEIEIEFKLVSLLWLYFLYDTSKTKNIC